jgi:hypothetical protein
MLADLRRRRKKVRASRVVVGYEASGAGYGLYDDVADAEFECYVLAPSRMKRSHKSRRMKTDERDAEMIRYMHDRRGRRRGVHLCPFGPRSRAAPDREFVIEHIRGHFMANNELCAVWVPDHETRDDRELMRSRLDAAEKLASLKGQVKNLLKRNGLRRPKHTGKGWTEAPRQWVFRLIRREGGPRIERRAAATPHRERRRTASL